MKCPVCGAAELIPETIDMPFTYKGETTIIAAVRGSRCPACGEFVIDKQDAARVDRSMGDFVKAINGTLVDPIFILATRRRLGLDQKEAAELFGGGVNAFSRYETGKAKPPRATVALLRLLARHPELLQEVRAGAAGARQPGRESPAARRSRPKAL